MYEAFNIYSPSNLASDRSATVRDIKEKKSSYKSHQSTFNRKVTLLLSCRIEAIKLTILCREKIDAQDWMPITLQKEIFFVIDDKFYQLDHFKFDIGREQNDLISYCYFAWREQKHLREKAPSGKDHKRLRQFYETA